jgi:RimJ/RimL family protein N-acetyltransferase
MKYILETDRLKLREFTLRDAPFIVELLNSALWLEFIGDRNVRTLEQATNYLTDGPIKSYRENGFGLSLVETKESSISVGMCGIIKRVDLDAPDIGFAILPQYIKKGFGQEIAAATLKHAVKDLQLPKVYAITKPHNANSINVLEKIGLNFIKPFHFPNDKQELFLYST